MANLSDIITPTNIVTAASTTTMTNKTINGSNNTITNVALTTGVAGTLAVANGGTGGTTSTGTGAVVLDTSPALVTPALGTPTSGVLTNTTGLPLTTGVTGTLPVANGGTGATSLTANNVLLGNGTSAPQAVAPSTSGNILTSDGTTWASTAPAAGGPTAGYWVLLQTVTGTAAATFDFTSFVNAAYSQYRIEGVLDYGGGTSLDLGARIYNSGSLVTSAYSAATGGREATTAWTNFNNASHMSLMGGSTPQYADPVSLTINLDVSPYAIGISGTTTGWRGSSYQRGTFFVGGSYVGSLTGIRIYMASGSGTRTGSLRVWGFKKS